MITFEDYENKRWHHGSFTQREGTWHGRRLGVYKKEDLRSLSLRTADSVDLQRAHEWFRAAADLCEITRPRHMDGSFESEFFF